MRVEDYNFKNQSVVLMSVVSNSLRKINTKDL